MVSEVIDEIDQVSYTEAEAITGRDRRYLARLVIEGRLIEISVRGLRGAVPRLSRSQLEQLALAEYRRGKAGPYWRTVRQAASELGVSDQTVRKRLPLYRAGNGDRLTKHSDVIAAAFVLTPRHASALLDPSSGTPPGFTLRSS